MCEFVDNGEHMCDRELALAAFEDFPPLAI